MCNDVDFPEVTEEGIYGLMQKLDSLVWKI